jgi:hypothetical protein
MWSGQVKPIVIAFYLPQFHPIPENNSWWGNGFTEWTNVGKAKSLFPGHYQPRVPKDLGYYDLRVPELREQQAEMAKANGVDAFCYWHYWFGNGKQLLERPFNEVLKSGKPDFPFCLGWANESWKGFSHGLRNREVLIEQKYFGEEDCVSHFYSVLPAFRDKRYLKIDDKPIFLIYRPYELPNGYIEKWRSLAKENGLKGITFIAQIGDVTKIKDLLDKGYDFVNIVRMMDYFKHHKLLHLLSKIRQIVFRIPHIIPYKKAIRYFQGSEDRMEQVIPTIYPGWDHTPRSGIRGLVLNKSTPDLFETHIEKVVRLIASKPIDHRVIFLKSWNEWAEGNYIEPDLKFGDAYLRALKRALER